MSRLARIALPVLACLAPDLARADVDLLVARSLGDELVDVPLALAATPHGLAVVGAGAQLWTTAGEPTDRRIAADIDDVTAVGDDLALVGPDGLVYLDSLGEVAWQVPAARLGARADDTRWRVAADERTVAVLAGDSVHTFHADGRARARWSGDAELAAIAVADDLVVTTGLRRISCDDEPRDVAVLTAATADGQPRWSAYDHDASSLCAAGRVVAASTRGVDVAFGDDARVYLLAEADGADSPLRVHPNHLGVRANTEIFDGLSDPDEAQRGKIAYYARFDRAGEHLVGQFLGLPATDSEPSRLSPRAIAATSSGLVIVAGSTNRTFTGADETPGTEALGQDVGFVQVIDADFTGRQRWDVLEDLEGEHAVVDLALVGDSVVGLVSGAAAPGDALIDLPLADPATDPTAKKKVTKHPDNDTQATFGFESGVSGSDPTCYCDEARTPGPAALALGLLTLAGLPRPRRKKLMPCSKP
jgi:hypothetical protein